MRRMPEKRLNKISLFFMPLQSYETKGIFSRKKREWLPHG
jgi:hypothetical protein